MNLILKCLGAVLPLLAVDAAEAVTYCYPSTIPDTFAACTAAYNDVASGSVSITTPSGTVTKATDWIFNTGMGSGASLMYPPDAFQSTFSAQVSDSFANVTSSVSVWRQYAVTESSPFLLTSNWTGSIHNTLTYDSDLTLVIAYDHTTGDHAVTDTLSVLVNGIEVTPKVQPSTTLTTYLGYSLGHIASDQAAAVDVGLTLSGNLLDTKTDFYSTSFQLAYVAYAVPEPGTYALFLLGLGGLALVRRCGHATPARLKT